MLLRRITQHVKNQNWFAVFLDFIIVVAGVFIGLQVQDWAIEKKRLSSERQYLERLHDEVEQLAITRDFYNRTRQEFSQALMEIAEVINSENDGAQLTAEQCRIIAHSSFTTNPPAELPSATEMISSGRLDQIESADLRDSILGYIQDVARTSDLIITISDSNIELSRAYPDIIQTKVVRSDYLGDTVDLIAACDLKELIVNSAFLNDFNANAFMYIVYTERGVLTVSDKLKQLHIELDKTLGIKHPEQEVK